MLVVDGKNVSLRRAKAGVLRKTVWATIEEATDWGTVHSEELREFYCTPKLID
jgi:hypothetical protein